MYIVPHYEQEVPGFQFLGSCCEYSSVESPVNRLWDHSSSP